MKRLKTPVTVARLQAHTVEIVAALHNALRHTAELDIAEGECWTIVDMDTDWGDPEATCPVYTHTSAASGTVKAHLYAIGDPRCVLGGNPIQMFVWHTSRYWDTGDGRPFHEYTLWLALPEEVKRFDFSFDTRTSVVTPGGSHRDMAIPKWAQKWVDNRKKSMKS